MLLNRIQIYLCFYQPVNRQHRYNCHSKVNFHYIFLCVKENSLVNGTASLLSCQERKQSLVLNIFELLYYYILTYYLCDTMTSCHEIHSLGLAFSNCWNKLNLWDVLCGWQKQYDIFFPEHIKMFRIQIKIALLWHFCLTLTYFSLCTTVYYTQEMIF